MSKTPKAGTERGDQKYCGSCKQWKPLTQFLPQRKGVKYLFCLPCASRNMTRWARTANVGLKPEDIQEIAE